MESEEEKQRKQDIAEELLNEYDEYLNEDKKFEIENRLERMRLRRILSIQQRVEEEASADPEEEKEASRGLYTRTTGSIGSSTRRIPRCCSTISTSNSIRILFERGSSQAR